MPNTIEPFMCGGDATFLSNYFDHIITPRRSTTYVDAAYCYRPSSVVGLSVCLSQKWALQQQLNRLRCRLVPGLVDTGNRVLDGGPDSGSPFWSTI